MATTVTFGNFKGGTGKTTNSTMISYQLAKQGYKTLLVDMDPQGNATGLFLKTKQRLNGGVVTFEKTLMTAINDEDLGSIVTPIIDNLDLLPSYADFTSYPNFLEAKYPNNMYKRATHFSKLLNEFNDNYDFLLIDVPPTVSLYTDNALMASDFTVIVMQTQERSLEGAEAYIHYLQELIQNYDAQLDILGILPVLLKNQSQVDKSILELAHEKFGDNNMFQTVIKNMERLKRYDVIGIGDPKLADKTDVHDMRVEEQYRRVTKEFLQRLVEKGVDIYGER